MGHGPSKEKNIVERLAGRRRGGRRENRQHRRRRKLVGSSGPLKERVDELQNACDIDPAREASPRAASVRGESHTKPRGQDLAQSRKTPPPCLALRRIVHRPPHAQRRELARDANPQRLRPALLWGPSGKQLTAQQYVATIDGHARVRTSWMSAQHGSPDRRGTSALRATCFLRRSSGCGRV